MAHKYAHYRGQRFSVIKEDEKTVTLSGFGYSKKHPINEVIFEEVPEDKMPEGLDDTSGFHPPQDKPAVELPHARKDNEIVLAVTEEQPRDDAYDMTDDLVDPSPKAASVSPREKREIERAETQRLTVPKDIKDRPKVRESELQGAFEEEKVVVPADPQPTSTSTEVPHGTKDFPNYPKIGIDVSNFTVQDRHEENEKRRVDALKLFKEKLVGMLKELDMNEWAPVNSMETMSEEPIEGATIPYESFDQFFKDFMLYARENDFISPDKEIDVDHAVIGLTSDPHSATFIKSLGGVDKAVSILSKKLAQAGLKPLEPSMTEDSAASGGQGGPVASGPAAGPGTTTSAVANYDAPIGIGTRKRPLNEEEPKK